MNMVPPSVSSHQSPGNSSVIPPPQIPRPPTATTGLGATALSGHPGHQSMSSSYGHHGHRPLQQTHGMGPSGPSYPPMSAAQCLSPRGGPPPGLSGGRNHPSGSSSPYQHPMHSSSNPPRPSHLHQHQQIPPQMHQPHHTMRGQQSHNPALQPPQQHLPPPQQYHQQPHHQQPHHQQPHHPQQHHPPPQAAPPPHQQPPRQQMPHVSSAPTSSSSNGLNGDWQSDRDMDHRRRMIQNMSAPSFSAYADRLTLKQRLQRLAIEIAKKTDSQNPSPNGPNQPIPKSPRHDSVIGNSIRSQAPSQPRNSDRNNEDYQVRLRHKQQRLLLLHHSSKCRYDEGLCPVTPHCADMKKLWSHMSSCTDTHCTVAHCFSSRSILSHYRKCTDTRCPVCGPVKESVRKGSAIPKDPVSRPPTDEPPPNFYNHENNLPQFHVQKQFPGQKQFPDQPSVRRPPEPNEPKRPGKIHYPDATPPPQQEISSGGGEYDNTSQNRPGSRNSLGPHSTSSNSVPDKMMNVRHLSSNDRRDGDTHDRIKHKQQRLLLLRHASKCKEEDGKCNVTPHCTTMKKLWKHISGCQNARCQIPHCMSSRYVLSHYKRCREADCITCAPVRRMKPISSNPDICIPIAPPSDYQIPPRIPEKNISQQNQDIKREGKVPAQKRPISRSPTPTTSNSTPAIFPVQIPVPVPVPVPVSIPVPVPVPVPVPGPDRGLDKPKHKHKHEQDEEQKQKKEKEQKHPTPSNNINKKKETSYSLINSFSVDQIETHIKSLNCSNQLPKQVLKLKCTEVLKIIQNHQYGWVFNQPVDPVELKLPDYLDVIKTPMDLGTVAKKLLQDSYHNIEDFDTDVRLTFDNSMLYNEVGSTVHDMANELKIKFVREYNKLLDQLVEEEESRRQNERACRLCGCEKLLFEPPVFFCSGMKCASQRISRNRYYYTGGSGKSQYYWCNQCYNELDDNAKIEFPDLSVKKTELTRKKNDEIHEESWVQCDTCNSWNHQICGLFNLRQNKDHCSQYNCPNCLLEQLKLGKIIPKTNAATAEALPRTKLSEWLENSVSKKMSQKYHEIAKHKTEVEKMSFEKAHALVHGGRITIRQVTSTDRKLEVQERMKNRYAHKNYPSEFSYRCKCLVVFQNLDGVDVLLFALYVYEHGEDNPAPNTRAVYISYLDSVHFMRPRKLRTFVYHEILIAYLDYARKRGFATAHIWACPPLKGDDYIFYAKPEDQKTPKDNRLRQWYVDMLIESQKRDIVGKITNMYEQYFSNEKLDATSVPYLEGDYFRGEAENIIKELEEGKSGKGKSASTKNKKKKDRGSKVNISKNKNKDSRNGTRSTVADEEISQKHSQGEVGEIGIKKEEFVRDQVMVQLGQLIKPMKESFLVAYLNWEGAKEEDLVVPQEVLEYRAKKKEDSSRNSNSISGKKRQLNGKVIEEESFIGNNSNKNGSHIKVIDDDLEELDFDFFNNRQLFLNLCRGNDYQFDDMRRAKHTSMMILWLLHNRGAAKFVQQCAACSREILSGKRYHCQTCSDYDLCHDCYEGPNTNRGLCTHKLVAISVDGENSQGGNKGTSKLTEQEKKERQRNIQLHIQLIEHAAKCNGNKCTSQNCAKMKQYLNHGAECKIKINGGCKTCRRMFTLLKIHAYSCKNKVCLVPQCTVIREKIRLLAQQQQAMDDRRRQEMNRSLYSSRE